MIRKQVIQAGLGVLILAVLFAFGCVTPKDPGSDNVTSTGTVLRVTNIDAKDGATGNNTTDVVIHLCPSGKLEKLLYDVAMDVTLVNDSPASGSSQSTTVTITSYTVQYISNEPGSVPLAPERVVTQTIVINPGASQARSGLLLMSVETKFEFIQRGGDPLVFPTYQAKVTFYGVNEFGYTVKAVASTYLEVGDWDTC